MKTVGLLQWLRPGRRRTPLMPLRDPAKKKRRRLAVKVIAFLAVWSGFPLAPVPSAQGGSLSVFGYYFYLYVVKGGPGANPDYAAESLAYAGHVALDVAGNAIPVTDIPSVTYLNGAQIKKTSPGKFELSATLGLHMLTSGNKSFFPLLHSSDFRRISDRVPGAPPAPKTWVIGANLWDAALRPEGTYNNRAPRYYPRGDSYDVAWEYDNGTFVTQAIGLGTGNTLSNVVKVGDTVPARTGNPLPGVGTTFTALSGPDINSTHVAFQASGTGFTGIYAKRLSDGAVQTVAENFSTNEFGSLNYVRLHGSNTVLFSGREIFKASLDGATPPVPLLPAPIEYEPGKFFRGGTIRDIDGNIAALEALESGKSAIFTLNLTDLSVKSIVKAGMPIPGTAAGTFGLVQRPVVSDTLVVFEGFDQTFAYAGLFGWFNGARFPLVPIGSAFDGKTVKFVDFQPEALEGPVMGFTVHFTDNSYGAYLGAFLPDIRIDSIASAPNGDIVIEGTGFPGSNQQILASEDPAVAFVPAATVLVNSAGKFTYTDPKANDVFRKFYRTQGIDIGLNFP
jgi:hypothetical protein